MPSAHVFLSMKARLDALRTEFADLAFELERKGRRDAADVVMMLDQRVLAVAGEIAADEAGKGGMSAQPAGNTGTLS